MGSENNRYENELEEIYTITETAGEFRLEIHGIKTTENQSGHYEVKINELRPKAPNDSSTLKAVAAMNEGMRLYGKFSIDYEPTEESKKASVEKLKEAILLFQAANYPGGEIDALREIGKVYYLGLRDDPKAFASFSQQSLSRQLFACEGQIRISMLNLTL